MDVPNKTQVKITRIITTDLGDLYCDIRFESIHKPGSPELKSEIISKANERFSNILDDELIQYTAVRLNGTKWWNNFDFKGFVPYFINKDFVSTQRKMFKT